MAEVIKKYRWALLWSALVFAFDGIGSGTLALAPWTILVNGVVRLPLYFFKRKGLGSYRALKVQRCLLLASTSVLTIAYCMYLQHLAIESAVKVSNAVELYKASTGQYPENLGSLQPAYLLELPKLEPVLSPPKFKYYLTKNEPLLMFTPGLWPRPTVYNFKKRTWLLED